MKFDVKKRVFEILDMADNGDKASRIWDVFIMALITTNVIAVIFETVEQYSLKYGTFFRWFEIFSVVVFTIEYILRLWAVTSQPSHRRPVVDRMKYALKFMSIIDLLAILPFYIPMFLPCDLRFLRALRLFRMLRILKIGRYSKAMITIGRVLNSKKEELAITGFVLGILLVLASSLMYYVENTAQPDVFTSIPAAMWWGIATLTTVGYGDIYPVTILGKVLGAFIAVLGIGLFALPAGILAGGFGEELKSLKNKDNAVS
ncbi:MAG TPA: ion transporter [candidate division Zixibacteria bacterium]|nr:ion transporter [candidate division Zixibacteria bacterium]